MFCDSAIFLIKNRIGSNQQYEADSGKRDRFEDRHRPGREGALEELMDHAEDSIFQTRASSEARRSFTEWSSVEHASMK